VAEASYFLFDGYNLMHAAGLERREDLVDRLAGWVALRGARGVLVFDGVGDTEQRGPLEVRFAVPADHLIERLAAEHRERELVCLVSSDNAIRGTVGQAVRKVSSQGFVRELAAEAAAPPSPAQRERTRVEDALDESTRRRLDRFRRRRN
jgi:predicted RNA-binding protein with PIN domain